MRKIHQISVVDPNSLSSEGLKHALHGRDFHIVDRWVSIAEAIECAPSDLPLEAILISQAKLVLPPLHIMTQLRQAYPKARIVLIGESRDPERIREAIRIDMDGFLLETIHITAFSKAIELVILGEQVFPPLPLDIAARTLAAPSPAPKPCNAALESLSASEMRVLALLSTALANKVIAHDLGISESTVKVHVKSILRKTGSRNRTDAALLVQGIGAKAYLEDLAKKRPNGLSKNAPLGGESIGLQN